jgi:hypothetical protein
MGVIQNLKTRSLSAAYSFENAARGKRVADNSGVVRKGLSITPA